MTRLTTILKLRHWIGTRAGTTLVCPLAATLLFLLSGLGFLAHLGLQNDEALFAAADFEPKGVAYLIQLGRSRFPLMLMTYLGTLKSWIYRPIFQLFHTGIWAIRLPMLLAGAASIWLFYLLLRRVAGERAAWIGCGLLAVDSLYLLTICFDWGPVALQHLLLIAGGLLLVRFCQTESNRSLGWGFCLWGLAMWDKALAVWMLSGFFVAALVIGTRSIIRMLSVRRALIAAAGFCLGALPLIIYNAENRLITFRSNTSWVTNEIPGKARLLRGTADGSALFGWLVYEDWQTESPQAMNAGLPAFAKRISDAARQPRHNLMVYAFGLALLLTPLARGTHLRAILFAVVAMTIAWLQMAVTANAGGSVHHAILIWPLPQMVIAISFAATSRRLGRAGAPLVAAMVAMLMISSLLVTNEYYTRLRRNGGGPNWTDAIFALSDYMKGSQAKFVFSVDWGIMDSLRLLNRGKLPLRVGSDPISHAELTPADRQLLTTMIGEPDRTFIGHTKEFEFFAGLNQKLVNYAEAAGYRREMMAEIADGNGRKVYEVYRFVQR